VRSPHLLLCGVENRPNTVQQEFVLTAILLATALCAGAALVLSVLHWKSWKAERINPGLSHQKAQPVDPPVSEGPRVDWRIEYEFNTVFMTTSKNGKEALIKRWTERMNCDRQEAIGWRSKNRGGLIGNEPGLNRPLISTGFFARPCAGSSR